MHRLGDAWVQAEVANWDYRLLMHLDANGFASVSVVNIHTGKEKDLFLHTPIQDVFAIGFEATPPPSQKKARRGHRHNRLLDDALASLEDTA